MKLVLVDSPFANLANICRALATVNTDPQVTSDVDRIASARAIVLPGVGSFAAAAAWLRDSGIEAALKEAVASGAALLGICVGHQLLFDDSDEDGPNKGLQLVRGSVRLFEGSLPVPQIGWNPVEHSGHFLFDGIGVGTPFYFVNSYRAVGACDEIASATYGERFTAAVASGRVYGLQFHPEKSSAAGLRVLSNFVRNAEAA